uniref:Uncharacterized protein n=1 Tax=Magallana gigas TaxID=29159 RepID=A0A8W8IY08_MAGGI
MTRDVSQCSKRTLGNLRSGRPCRVWNSTQVSARNIQTKNQQLRSAAYKAMVRPQLEYAASVWDPHLATHTNQIEAVQRRAAKWVMSDYSRTSSKQVYYMP